METPLSAEASMLRPSQAPGMLAMLSNNLNRDVREVRLFEQGMIFSGTPFPGSHEIAEVHEYPQLTLGITIPNTVRTPLFSAEDAPIFELKAAVESLTSLFALPGGADALSFTIGDSPSWLEPGRSATAVLDGTPLAYFGELARNQAQQRKLRQTVYLAQLDLARLYLLPLRRASSHEISRYQTVERDFSFSFPDSVQYHTISATMTALAIPEMLSFRPVEIYRDKKSAEVYSLLLRTIFQSFDRTLRDEELIAWSERIIGALAALGGILRA
jgi:phenylalanyl-tRNA synthetase beta chain